MPIQEFMNTLISFRRGVMDVWSWQAVLRLLWTNISKSISPLPPTTLDYQYIDIENDMCEGKIEDGSS